MLFPRMEDVRIVERCAYIPIGKVIAGKYQSNITEGAYDEVTQDSRESLTAYRFSEDDHLTMECREA